MKILRADPEARILDEEEIRLFLERPFLMRLGVVDEEGFPVVYPLWHVFEDGVFWATTGRDARKVRLLRGNPKAYYTVDIGDAGRAPKGVRGRAEVTVIDDRPELAESVVRKTLSRYMDASHGPLADEFIQAARQGETCVLRIAPLYMATWSYR